MWAVAGGDTGKQMFRSWKSCSWILDCVYIPRRYAMWKCLEIGNSVLAEWVKDIRWKKSLSSFPRDLPNSSFLHWFAHPADVSAQISLLVFSSYTVCQAHMHIHLNEELVQLMISVIPTVGERAWGQRCDQVHTHKCPQAWRQQISTSCVVLSSLGNCKWLTSGHSRGFASEKQYLQSPECCYVPSWDVKNCLY